MTVKIHLLIFILSLSLISACTTGQASPENRQEIVIADDTSKQNKNEVVITEADLTEKLLQKAAEENNTKEQTVTLDDNSKVTTTFDGYNNKTETRCFVNHPRLDCIVVKTSADGTKQVIIYPFSNGGKQLPEDTAGKAFTASPDELANLAGFSETRSDIAKKPVSPYGSSNDSTSLQPLPSSAFPVFPKQVPQTAVEENSAQTREETPPQEGNNENQELEN